MIRIQSGETYKDVPEDAQGRFPANCSVCFNDKTCIGINYQRIIDICAKFGVTAHGFAVCEDCSKGEPHSLFRNLMDYFVMDELYRWLIGNKDGIVKSDLEFKTLLSVAFDNGIIYREEKRTRHRYTKEQRVMNMGLINMLKRENTGDYIPNPLMSGLFKKLYEG